VRRLAVSWLATLFMLFAAGCAEDNPGADNTSGPPAVEKGEKADSYGPPPAPAPAPSASGIGNPASPPSGRGQSEDAAKQLAAIDGYSPGSAEAKRISALLDKLDAAFPETRQQIGDMTAKAVSGMQENFAVSEKCLTLLEGMNSVYGGQTSPRSYAEVMGAYLGVRARGETHKNAVASLQALMGRIPEMR
jgi:hypothetical protein